MKISGGISPQIMNGGRTPPDETLYIDSEELFIEEFIEDNLIFGGSVRDPPWVPLKSANTRVLCSYWGGGG